MLGQQVPLPPTLVDADAVRPPADQPWVSKWATTPESSGVIDVPAAAIHETKSTPVVTEPSGETEAAPVEPVAEAVAEGVEAPVVESVVEPSVEPVAEAKAAPVAPKPRKRVAKTAKPAADAAPAVAEPVVDPAPVAPKPRQRVAKTAKPAADAAAAPEPAPADAPRVAPKPRKRVANTAKPAAAKVSAPVEAAEVAEVAPEPVDAPARVAPKSRRRVAAVKIDTEVDEVWATVESPVAEVPVAAAPAAEPVIDLTAAPAAAAPVESVVETPTEPVVVETPAEPVVVETPAEPVVIDVPAEPVREAPTRPTAAAAAANWARPKSVWRDRVFNTGYERRQNDAVAWPPPRRTPPPPPPPAPAPRFIDLEAEAAADTAPARTDKTAPAE